MKPKYLDGKWYVEIFTEEFGNVLLLDKYKELPIPVSFNSEKEVLDYIKVNTNGNILYNSNT